MVGERGLGHWADPDQECQCGKGFVNTECKYRCNDLRKCEFSVVYNGMKYPTALQIHGIGTSEPELSQKIVNNFLN